MADVQTKVCLLRPTDAHGQRSFYNTIPTSNAGEATRSKMLCPHTLPPLDFQRFC